MNCLRPFFSDSLARLSAGRAISVVFMTVVLSCLLLTLVSAQTVRRGASPDERRDRLGPALAFEPVVLSPDSSGRMRVDVIYRIPKGFFVFVADPADPTGARYTAGAEISVEFVNQDGKSVARKIVRRSFERPHTDEQNQGQGGTAGIDYPPDAANHTSPEVVGGLMTFTLPVGTLQMVTEVIDRESPRRFFNDDRKVTVRDIAKPGAATDLLFAEVGSGDSTVLHPLNYGPDLPFGSNFDAYFQIQAGVPKDSLLVSYTLNRSAGKAPAGKGEQHRVPASRLVSGGYQMTLGSDSTAYALRPGTGRDRIGVWIPLHGDTLEEGHYTLSVRTTVSGKVDSFTREFGVRWLDSPRSLRMQAVALQAMSYVLSDSEYARYRSASDDEFKKMFDDFWKKKDPTPGTAYNEALAEYFRRVDYAMTTFSSLTGMNGFKTDRGKTYIVYGPPGRTERMLSPSAFPQEIWYYSRLRRKFTFIDQKKKGDYKLVSVDGMQ